MSLHILVQVWCELDPTLNVRIDRQTSELIADEGDQLRRISPLGRAGVEAARQLASARITAFALGSGHEPALRYALASGATSAVELQTPDDQPETGTMLALANWLARQQADLVIADRQAGRLAARLGWAHLAGLVDVQVQHKTLSAVRLLERGNREAVTARLPAVVRLAEESLLVPYIARARLHAAAAHPLVRQTLAGPELSTAGSTLGPLQPARVRTRTPQSAAPAAASASDRLGALMGLGRAPTPSPSRLQANMESTPEQLAEELVRYLTHHGLLPESSPPSQRAPGD
jgi:electron transfer flavoprotein alpha/beta subunit